MSNKKSFSVIIIISIIALCLGLFTWKLIRQNQHQLSHEELAELNAYPLMPARQIASFNLTDNNKQPFTNNNLTGKWTVLYFGFTYCPDICPTTLSTLSHAKANLDKLNIPIQYMLVTVDPERDTPEKLTHYLNYINDEFIGITGELTQLVHFTKQFNAIFAKAPGGTPKNYLVDHSANVIIINPQGQYHAFLRPPHTKENIATAIKAMAQ